ncbi:hypothetical protein [Granulicella arctica]|uniref:hypothetical protein n=1 Tax=Granulicella arctica TaxID=940613 RepID=UPI0021DFAA76|nr:hypothetical protein [Granulicella arctica]
MIEAWTACVTHFRTKRGREPKSAEIFLSHSPCTTNDLSPSVAETINGVLYPASCRGKLTKFFQVNSTMKWKIWYALRFGHAEGLTDEQLKASFPNIAIQSMQREVADMAHL